MLLLSAAGLLVPLGPRAPDRSGWFPDIEARAQAHILILPPISLRGSGQAS